MSKINLNNYKQRFKAIESFLRRVAFNLGNTASQTEVKIISCIPIDVTDLQQKICCLEKELEEVRKTGQKDQIGCNPSCPGPPTAVCTLSTCCNAKGDDVMLEEACNAQYSNISSVHCSNIPNKQRQMSSCSFSCRSEPSHECPYYSDHIISAKTDKQYEQNFGRKSFFLRKKNKNKRKKCNAQVVYYAQTNERTPFNSYSYSDDFTSKNAPKDADENVVLSRTFLVDMFQKQYKPEPILKVFSNSSNFSAPVCRDDIATTSKKCKCDSETCSCCHGPFQNIDHHMNRKEIFGVPTSVNYNKNRYYDSNLYDLVPVREKAAKIRNNIEMPRRKKAKRQNVLKGIYPEDIRPNSRIPPVVVNYETIAPVRTSYRRHFPVKKRSRKQIVNEMAKITTNFRPLQPPRDDHPSRVCCVDYGPVYPKQVLRKSNKKISPDNKNSIKNDVSRPVTTSNQTDVPKVPPMPVANVPINKTEITLNQIKSILQSVLLEVKTNSKFGKDLDPPKKDAVVQNGVSQSYIHGGSQLLQSFTYSPYNMSPYSASCSRQIYPSNYTTYSGLPGGPVRCMPHYPILIQPQRHRCNTCFKNTNVAKSDNTKQAASAATNTEHSQVPNNETEHLIKEIYKSIAMNLEIPQKDTAVNNKLHLFAHHSATLGQGETNKVNNSTGNPVSEIFRNTTQLDSSVTRNTDTVASKPTSNEVSVGSDFVTTNKPPKPERVVSLDDVGTGWEANDRELDVERISQDLESDEQSDGTVVDQETDASSSETESDDVVVEIEKPRQAVDTVKKGLFNKMFKMFKPKENEKINKKKAASIKQVENDSDSNSDDYQTIYSHRVARHKPLRNVINIRSKPHSKVGYSKIHQQRRSRSPEKARRLPYMEQEHRRHWNEKLMFHDNQQERYSSIMSRDTGHRAPVYTQNYEARAALVNPVMTPNLPDYTMTQNYDYGANNTMHPDNMSNYTRNTHFYARTNPNFNQGIWINYSGKQNPSPGNENNANANKPHIIIPRAYKGQQKISSKGLAWLKKRKACGEQWKNFILES